jgi:hypothetical protein
VHWVRADPEAVLVELKPDFGQPVVV